ncbi:MAG: S8 family serine peptidase, partial [Bdellovibrionales bacterium]|nr:S8 family serine peptidase [Bdellovibrionales bacterium]
TIVIAAAGNDSKNIDNRKVYPASFENESLFVVASTTSYGGLSYFSNYGTKNVDIAAPGSSVYSTVIGNRYQSMSGTSMASPVVAGLAAEVLSRFPELGPVELKQTLMNTVNKVRSFKRKVSSGGRGDLLNAVNTLNL